MVWKQPQEPGGLCPISRLDWREGTKQRLVPTEKAACAGGSRAGAGPGYPAILRKGSRGVQRRAGDLGNRPCPLDPWTLSCLGSPGRLGLLDAHFLNSLGLKAWVCPSQKATASPQCPFPMPSSPAEGREHDSLLGGRASPETQGGHGPPSRLQLTLPGSHGSVPRARPTLQTPTKHWWGAWGGCHHFFKH